MYMVLLICYNKQNVDYYKCNIYLLYDFFELEIFLWKKTIQKLTVLGSQRNSINHRLVRGYYVGSNSINQMFQIIIDRSFLFVSEVLRQNIIDYKKFKYYSVFTINPIMNSPFESWYKEIKLFVCIIFINYAYVVCFYNFGKIKWRVIWYLGYMGSFHDTKDI